MYYMAPCAATLFLINLSDLVLRYLYSYQYDKKAFIRLEKTQAGTFLLHHQTLRVTSSLQTSVALQTLLRMGVVHVYLWCSLLIFSVFFFVN